MSHSIILLILLISGASALYTKTQCRKNCEAFGNHLKQNGHLQKSYDEDGAKMLARKFCEEEHISVKVCNNLVSSSKYILDYTRAGQDLAYLCSLNRFCPQLLGIRRRKPLQNKKSQRWNRIKSKIGSLLGLFTPVQKIVMNVLGEAEKRIPESALLPEEPEYLDICTVCRSLKSRFLKTSSKHKNMKMIYIFRETCSKFLPKLLAPTYCTEAAMKRLIEVTKSAIQKQPTVCEDITFCSTATSHKKTTTKSLKKEVCSICANLEFIKSNVVEISRGTGKTMENIVNECQVKYPPCVMGHPIKYMIQGAMPSFLKTLKKENCEQSLNCGAESDGSLPFGVENEGLYCNVCRKLSRGQGNHTGSEIESYMYIFCSQRGSKINECLKNMRKIALKIQRSDSLSKMCEDAFCKRDSKIKQTFLGLIRRKPSDNLCQMCRNGLDMFSNKKVNAAIINNANSLCDAVSKSKCLNETLQIGELIQNLYVGRDSNEFCRELSVCGQNSDSFMNKMFKKLQGMFKKWRESDF